MAEYLTFRLKSAQRSWWCFLLLTLLLASGCREGEKLDSSLQADDHASGNNQTDVLEDLDFDSMSEYELLMWELRHAILERDLGTVTKIVSTDVSPNAVFPGDEGMTLLMMAAASYDPDIVSFLLEQGACVEARDEYASTALHDSRSLPVIQLLVEAGADPNARNMDGRTILMKSIAKAEVEWLMKNGADPTIQDNDGRDALWWHTNRWSFQGVTELLEAHVAENEE